jgi:hypothetical protein
MKKTLAAVVIAGLAMTTTACNGDNGDASSDPASAGDAKAASSISSSIMEQQKSGSAMPLKQGEADCIGKGLVDTIGTDQLQKYKVVTADYKLNKQVTSVTMSHGDAVKATDTFFGCADVLGMVKAAMSESGQMPPQVKTCIDKSLKKDDVHDMFVGMFEGKAAQATAGLQQSLTKCASLAAGSKH